MYPHYSHMNKTSISYLNYAFGLLMMLTSLAYTFWSMTDWPDTYELVPTAHTVFVEDTKIPQEIKWPGDQVVAKLYRLSEENIPIEVSGVLFQSELDVKLKQSTVDLSSFYTKGIILDNNGKIVKLIFNKN